MSMHTATTQSPSRPLLSIAAMTRALVGRLQVWDDRRTTRRALARLDDHMLRDIGMDGAVAVSEAHKTFWQR